MRGQQRSPRKSSQNMQKNMRRWWCLRSQAKEGERVSGAPSQAHWTGLRLAQLSNTEVIG